MLSVMATGGPRTSSSSSSSTPAKALVRFDLHGHAVGLSLEVPFLVPAASAHLASLQIPAADPRDNDIEGAIVPYAEADVLRRISRDARPVGEDEPCYHPLLELYRTGDGGRWWIVDERWGMCEIDLVAGTWRSFVLPSPAVDDITLFESAVWWPMAILLRGRGLHLIPAASFGRNGRGVLLLSRADVTPELLALPQSGIGIIGQRWTALREEGDGSIALLPVPGRTLSRSNQSRSLAGDAPDAFDAAALLACGPARCGLVLLAEPMRRLQGSSSPLNPVAAAREIGLAWPVPPIGNAKANTLPTGLAKRCPIHRLSLGRDGSDLPRLLTGTHASRRAA